MEKKIDLPTFIGKMEPDVVMDWIDSLFGFFEFEDIPGHQKVKIAKSKLKGAALTWWNFVQEEIDKDNKPKIASWKRMVALIKEAYVPKDYEI